MEFRELEDRDTVGAFDKYVTLSKAKQDGLLPSHLHDSFPDRCSCGSERIITRDLTNMTCCDPRCPIKIAYSLRHVFSKFACKYVGEETCLSVVRAGLKHMPGRSHVYFLTHGMDYLPMDMGGAAIGYFRDAVDKVRNSKITFAEMVSRLAIPKFDTNALNVLGEVSGIVELVRLIDEEGSVQEFLANRNIMDPMKVFYFHEFMQDIAYAEARVFNGLLPIGKLDISVVVTGSLVLKGYKVSRDSYLDLCNNVGIISQGLRLFNVTKNTAVETTDYFIADFESNNRKYLKARERESFEGRKLIYSSEEFIEMLQGWVKNFKESKGIGEVEE